MLTALFGFSGFDKKVHVYMQLIAQVSFIKNHSSSFEKIDLSTNMIIVIFHKINTF